VPLFYLEPQEYYPRPFQSKLAPIIGRRYEISSVDRRETDIVLLNDTRVQTVEVHDQDEFVVQSLERFKNQPTFVLIFLLP
jgi:K+/H+ antiporter YhaU regulatory subunit KhtT